MTTPDTSAEVERIRALWARVDMTDRPMLDESDGMDPGTGVTSLYIDGREAVTLAWRTPDGRAVALGAPEQIAALLGRITAIESELELARFLADDDELSPVSRALGLPTSTASETVVEHVKSLLGSLAETCNERDRLATALHEAERERDEARAECLALRASRCTVEEANAVAAEYIRQRDALGESIEAALGDACTGDLAADVRRVMAERETEPDLATSEYDLARLIAEIADDESTWCLAGTFATATGTLATTIEAARPEGWRDRVLAGEPPQRGERDDELYAATDERTALAAAIREARPALVAGIHALGVTPEALATRRAAHEALDRLTEAAGDGPVGVVLSEVEAAAVREVLDAAERWKWKSGVTRTAALLEQIDAWIEAGRPLASKEG